MAAVGSGSAATQNKKAGTRPALVVRREEQNSVSRNHRAAPAVVDADGDEIDVLTSAIVAEGDADWRDEALCAVLHECPAYSSVKRLEKGQYFAATGGVPQPPKR